MNTNQTETQAQSEPQVHSSAWLERRHIEGRRALLKEIIAEAKSFTLMGRMSANKEIVNGYRLRRRVMEHRLKAL